MAKKQGCEICGKRDAKFLCKVEGAILEVCGPCSKSGVRIERIINGKENNKRIGPASMRHREEKETVLIEGYGKTIKKARENMGLSREEFSRKINESESYIERIEKEKVSPNEKVVKKIEKFLGIKLTTEISMSSSGKGGEKKSGDLTLADILEHQRENLGG